MNGSSLVHRRAIFLRTGEAVSDVVGSPLVKSCWEQPSVLPGMTVGALAAHVVEGSIEITLRTIERDPPHATAVMLTAAEYFVHAADMFTSTHHEDFRQRAETAAQAGLEDVISRCVSGLSRLSDALVGQPIDRRVQVFGDAGMLLDDYLVTRMVEQLVHLDDLARSLDLDPWWDVDPAAGLVVQCGAEIGLRRFGAAAMLRTLFRGHAEWMPVI